MDSLSPLFARFSLSAQVFYSGSFCGRADYDPRPGLGYLHVLREGTVLISGHKSKSIIVTEPSLIYFQRPFQHRIRVDNPAGAKLMCATIDFGTETGNPLLTGLPDILMVPLADNPGFSPMLTLLFDEAGAQREGREAALNRLTEYFVVLLLRYTVDAKIVNGGVLAALADARMTKVLKAMHERPAHPWSLEELSAIAGMSRARFAAHFRKVAGITPLNYLTDWRIGIAQTLLKHGKALKLVAPMVGYTSPIALTRVFAKRVGLSPGEWKNRCIETQTAVE